MRKISIENNTVQETLIVPLYARKRGCELFPHVLRDPCAAGLISRLDYDFSRLEQHRDSFLWKFGALEGILRSRDILCEMEQYLSGHPDAVIVNMGCGLDRTPLLSKQVVLKLYNIDLDSVIAIRNELLPPLRNEINIAADLKKEAWMEHIDASGGIFLFASGVFMYFREEEVRQLIQKLKGSFPHGCLVFDTVGKLGIRVLMKHTLINMGIRGVDGVFYSDCPLLDFGKEKNGSLSVRNFLTGYVNLEEESIPFLLRKAAALSDWLFRMRICRMEW